MFSSSSYKGPIENVPRAIRRRQKALQYGLILTIPFVVLGATLFAIQIKADTYEHICAKPNNELSPSGLHYCGRIDAKGDVK